MSSADLFDVVDSRSHGSRTPRPAAAAVAHVRGGPLELPGPLPAGLYLGTSSWAFPGWRGLVYEGLHNESVLSRQGLPAYAAHPLLRTVSIDRGFYQPLPAAAFRDYATQVPDEFRFVVKAPALVCDAALRDAAGRRTGDNPSFLDPSLAVQTFVGPCTDGLGAKAGPLVFQIPPVSREVYGSTAAFAERLAWFLERLPRELLGRCPLYAVELRNPELLTPRLVRILDEAGVRLCLGLHARMPDAGRQGKALAHLDGNDAGGDWAPRGPLVVRWNLHSGHAYEGARRKFAPFDRLVEEDLPTRRQLAGLARKALAAGQPVWIVANNKAEGCAPRSVRALCEEICPSD